MSDCPQLDLAQAQSPTLQAQGLHIASMTGDDLSQTLLIEKNTANNPWSETQFIDSMSSTVVLKDQNLVVGFAVLALVADQAELHNIAIHPDRQGQGLGTLFLSAVLDSLPLIIKMLYLEVRVTNFRAIRLYSQLGFNKIAERKGYYRTELGSEDALIMSKHLRC